MPVVLAGVLGLVVGKGLREAVAREREKRLAAPEAVVGSIGLDGHFDFVHGPTLPKIPRKIKPIRKRVFDSPSTG